MCFVVINGFLEANKIFFHILRLKMVEIFVFENSKTWILIFRSLDQPLMIKKSCRRTMQHLLN
jgi:hypothetical protein